MEIKIETPGLGKVLWTLPEPIVDTINNNPPEISQLLKQYLEKTMTGFAATLASEMLYMGEYGTENLPEGGIAAVLKKHLDRCMRAVEPKRQ